MSFNYRNLRDRLIGLKGDVNVKRPKKIESGRGELNNNKKNGDKLNFKPYMIYQTYA